VTYAYTRRVKTTDEQGSEYIREINIVDLGVLDEGHNFRGASGSDRTYFRITENEATPGYVKGKIGSGEMGACARSV
jgi:hypothetical protein